MLNPGDGDIRFNLELAQSKTVDKVTPISEMFFVTWTKSLANLMSEKGLGKNRHFYLHCRSYRLGTLFLQQKDYPQESWFHLCYLPFLAMHRCQSLRFKPKNKNHEA